MLTRDGASMADARRLPEGDVPHCAPCRDALLAYWDTQDDTRESMRQANKTAFDEWLVLMGYAKGVVQGLLGSRKIAGYPAAVVSKHVMVVATTYSGGRVVESTGPPHWLDKNGQSVAPRDADGPVLHRRLKRSVRAASAAGGSEGRWATLAGVPPIPPLRYASLTSTSD